MAEHDETTFCPDCAGERGGFSSGIEKCQHHKTVDVISTLTKDLATSRRACEESGLAYETLVEEHARFENLAFHYAKEARELEAERGSLRLALETAEANEEKLHETNERLALDLVDAEDDRVDLAEMYQTTADRLTAAYQVIDLDNAVCLCGCPPDMHEDNGEDGEQCEHEDHECIRVAPAVLEIVGRLRLALETATQELTEARADVDAMQAYGQEQRDRAVAAERERDALLSRPAPPADAPAFTHWTGSATRPDAPPADAPRTVREVVGVVDAVHALIRGDVAPSADAATEAVREAAERLRYAARSEHAEESLYIAAMNLLDEVDALLSSPTPAPAPSAKPCVNCDGHQTCERCGGSGGGPDLPHRCISCDGTGRCYLCAPAPSAKETK